MKNDVVGFGFKDEGAAMALLDRDVKSLTDDEKIAIEGLPKLGTDERAQIRVKESKEFKVEINLICTSIELRTKEEGIK